MSAGFIRRYPQNPGLDEIRKIEGVVIIDGDPPGQVQGVGSGVVTLVGEFENGPFIPQEVTTSDLASFGGFGFTYDGQPSNNPCARARYADGQIQPEYWNGNGFIAMVNKRFRRLFLVRVDTSCGEVSFTRQAFLTGKSDGTFDLEPAQTLLFDIGAGNVTVTIAAAAAVLNSSAGVYPTTFVGGEQMTYMVDDVVYQTVFLASDTSQALAIARLNATVGATVFSLQGGNITRLTGRRRGTAGKVQILSRDTLVGTALGFAVGGSPTAGTGDVADIDAVTGTELHTKVSGTVGLTTVRIERDAAGNLRAVNATSTGTGTIKLDATSTATAFGFPTNVVATAVTGVAGLIPAGTRVRNGSAVEWVTMQDVNVTAASAGPYKVKIRPALDDGSTLSTATNTITTTPSPIAIGPFAVTNLLPTTNALTESQIDAKYIAAIDQTKAVQNSIRETNIIVSARSSNAIRQALKANAVSASDSGCRGRMAFVRPPLGTTKVLARGATNPGVGTMRHRRTVYAWPGVNTTVPQIAARGTAGGAGFTADGKIDVGWDTWAAAIASQLPPENNPGQKTDFALLVNGLEVGNPDVQTLTMDDYAAFRASGIAAPRMANGTAIIQSGVTSVDPIAQSGLVNIARQRMADYVQDSLAEKFNEYSKQPMTKDLRGVVLSESNEFLATLLTGRPQRIDSYGLDAISQNKPTTLQAGVYWLITEVRTLSSMDNIVLDTKIGETVTITQRG